MAPALQEEVEQIKARFKQYDIDGDGVISLEELTQVMRACGNFSDEELAEMFIEIDASGDGKLGYDEFVDWVMGVDDSDEEIGPLADGTLIPRSASTDPTPLSGWRGEMAACRRQEAAPYSPRRAFLRGFAPGPRGMGAAGVNFMAPESPEEPVDDTPQLQTRPTGPGGLLTYERKELGGFEFFNVEFIRVVSGLARYHRSQGCSSLAALEALRVNTGVVRQALRSCPSPEVRISVPWATMDAFERRKLLRTPARVAVFGVPGAVGEQLGVMDDIVLADDKLPAADDICREVQRRAAVLGLRDVTVVTQGTDGAQHFLVTLAGGERWPEIHCDPFTEDEAAMAEFLPEDAPAMCGMVGPQDEHESELVAAQMAMDMRQNIARWRLAAKRRIEQVTQLPRKYFNDLPFTTTLSNLADRSAPWWCYRSDKRSVRVCMSFAEPFALPVASEVPGSPPEAGAFAERLRTASLVDGGSDAEVSEDDIIGQWTRWYSFARTPEGISVSCGRGVGILQRDGQWMVAQLAGSERRLTVGDKVKVLENSKTATITEDDPEDSEATYQVTYTAGDEDEEQDEWYSKSELQSKARDYVGMIRFSLSRVTLTPGWKGRHDEDWISEERITMIKILSDHEVAAEEARIALIKSVKWSEDMPVLLWGSLNLTWLEYDSSELREGIDDPGLEPFDTCVPAEGAFWRPDEDARCIVEEEEEEGYVFEDDVRQWPDKPVRRHCCSFAGDRAQCWRCLTDPDRPKTREDVVKQKAVGGDATWIPLEDTDVCRHGAPAWLTLPSMVIAQDKLWDPDDPDEVLYPDWNEASMVKRPQPEKKPDKDWAQLKATNPRRVPETWENEKLLPEDYTPERAAEELLERRNRIKEELAEQHDRRAAEGTASTVWRRADGTFPAWPRTKSYEKVIRRLEANAARR